MPDICQWCGHDVRWIPGRGWTHVDGGGSYMMTCKSCGYKAAIYPSPMKCPKCGASRDWVDDHCASKDFGSRTSH